MDMNAMFYKDEILKNYNKITENNLKEIMNIYKVNNKPSNFKFETRNNNYFVHNIIKYQKEYKEKTQAFYLEDKTTVVKTSGKTKCGYVKIKDLMYEKDMCRELWFSSYYGKAIYPFDIIDIQTPLKKVRNNKYGEIDNIGIDIKDNNITVYLIEAKPLNTDETLLRAIIETITYKYQIEENKEKFIEDLKKFIRKYNGKGEKILFFKEKLNNNENINIVLKSLVLVPKKLYEDHKFSKVLYDNYKNDIEFYYFEFTKEDLEYHLKDERKDSLFKENRYPRISKYE